MKCPKFDFLLIIIIYCENRTKGTFKNKRVGCGVSGKAILNETLLGLSTM